MIIKILIALLIINAIIQWECIIGSIDDIIKLERRSKNEF